MPNETIIKLTTGHCGITPNAPTNLIGTIHNGNGQICGNTTTQMGDMTMMKNDKCDMCGIPLVYRNTPTVNGKPVCDTCARANVSDVMRDTVKTCMVCKRIMNESECGDEFPNERVCDACANVHTIRELVREPNLTVCRVNGTLTIAIAHDGTLSEPTDIVDDIADMVCRFKLNHVTCITLVYSRQRLLYGVHAITPSNTVWHVTVNQLSQIAMSMNRIALNR